MADARKGGVVCATGTVFVAEEVDVGTVAVPVLLLEAALLARPVLPLAAFASAPAVASVAPLAVRMADACEDPIPDATPDEATGSRRACVSAGSATLWPGELGQALASFDRDPAVF